jgi:hypothetical protein
VLHDERGLHRRAVLRCINEAVRGLRVSLGWGMRERAVLPERDMHRRSVLRDQRGLHRRAVLRRSDAPLRNLCMPLGR